MSARRRLAVSITTLLIALAWSVAARAGVADCTGQSDGTPCTTTCETGGVCKNQLCKNGMPAPDGSPCATGSRCTVSDKCIAGVCTAGSMRQCFPGPCESATCNEASGCVYTMVCDMVPPPPDLHMPDFIVPPADLSNPAPDIAVAGMDLSGQAGMDLSGQPAPDLSGSSIADLSGSSSMSDLSGSSKIDLGGSSSADLSGSTMSGDLTGMMADGNDIIDGGGMTTDDSGVLLDDAGNPLNGEGGAGDMAAGHVHGSGCTCETGSRGAPPLTAIALSVLLVLALARRRK